jgi:hypothetical protein
MINRDTGCICSKNTVLRNRELSSCSQTIGVNAVKIISYKYRMKVGDSIREKHVV